MAQYGRSSRRRLGFIKPVPAQSATLAGAVALTADSTLTAAGVIGVAVALAGDSTLTAGGTQSAPGAVALSGTAALTTAATVPPPVAPGTQLNIGTSNTGKQRYELQTAYPGDSVITTKTVAQIAAGFDDGPGSTTTFGSNADGTWTRFRVRADAPLTSGAAGGPRSELREMELDGTTEKAFDPLTGTHWIQCTFRTIAAPDGHLNGIVHMQMHDDTSDSIEVCTQLVSGVIKLVFRINGTGSGLPKLSDLWQTSINATSAEATVRIAVGDFGWQIFYQDMSRPFCSSTDSGMPALTPSGLCYFKAGCYTQQDITEAIDTTRYSEMQIKSGSLMTYHSGYVDPRTLVSQPAQVSHVRAGALTVLQNNPSGSMNTAPAFPTGGDAPVDGDLLILVDWMFHSQENHAQGTVQTPTTPTGWTPKARTGVYAGPKTGTGASPYHAAIRLGWYYARYQSSGVGGVNSAPTMVVAGTQTDDWHASQILVMDGAIASGDPTDVLGAFNAFDATPALTAAASATALGPAAGITTILDGSIVLVAFFAEYGITNGTNVPVLTGDALSWVEASDYGGTTGNVMTTALDYALVPAAQTITDKTPTVAFTTSAKSVGQMWAIKRAPATVTAAVLLAGAASLTSAGVATAVSAVTLAGTGTLTSAGIQVAPGAVAMAADSALAAAGTQVAPGAVAMAGAASLAAAADMTAVGACAMSAAAALTTAGTYVGQPVAALAATASLTAGGTKVFPGAAALTGDADLFVDADRVTFTSTTLTGSGVLVAGGTREQPGAVALAATAALSTDGVRVTAGAANLTATAALVADATIVKLGAATLAASGDLVAAAVQVAAGVATLVGESTLTADGGPVLVTGAAVLAAAGLLDTAGTQIALPTVSLAGESALVVAGVAELGSGAALTASAVLAAAGLPIGVSSAALSGEAMLTVDVGGFVGAMATVAGVGSLAVAGTLDQGATVAMTADGALATAATLTGAGVAALTGDGVLAAGGMATRLSAAIMGGAAALSVAAVPKTFGAATMTGLAGLTAAAMPVRPGAATLAGVGGLTVAAALTPTAAAVLTGAGTLAALGVAGFTGAADLDAEALLFLDGQISQPTAAVLLSALAALHIAPAIPRWPLHVGAPVWATAAMRAASWQYQAAAMRAGGYERVPQPWHAGPPEKV